MKKRMIIYVLVSVVVMALVVSCGPDEPDGPAQTFLSKTEYGVYDGRSKSLTTLFVFTEKESQWATSAKAGSVRLQTDNMSKYLHVEMDAKPDTGETIEIKITPRGIMASYRHNMSAKVMKSTEGSLWLWVEEYKLGLLIPAYE